MKAFRVLAAVTAASVYLQIVLGGVVRITGSGLGCRDWPLCYQHESERFAYRTLIEVAHRLLGTVTGLLVLATVLAAVVLYRRGRNEASGRLLGLAATLLGLYILQAVLGGITVLTGNTPWTVAIHLGNSLLVLAAALLVAIWAGRVMAVPAPTPRSSGLFRKFVYGSTVAAYLIIVSGAYVVGAGASYACPAWPLCGAGGGVADIHMLHRVVVLLGGLVILRTIHYARRHWRRTGMAVVVYATAAALLLEVLVGWLQVSLRLPAGLRVLHLALATAVWSGTVIMTAVLREDVAPAGRRPSRLSTSLAEAGIRS